VDKGVFILFLFLLNVSLLLLPKFRPTKIDNAPFPLSSIGDLDLPSFSIDFPINP
jgi:hypothetical protein